MNSRKMDYYKILHLNPDCTPQEIRKSYRALALKWHPDKHVDTIEANSKFNDIREAYSVLIDPKKRQIYDSYGYQGIQNFEENNGFSDHPNTFLAKGFKGTEKSAFDVLWDILQEKEDDSLDQTDSSDQMPSDFKTDFFGLFESRANSEVDEDHFINNYQPTFTKTEFSAPPQEYTSLFARRPSSDLTNPSQKTFSQKLLSRSNQHQEKSRKTTGLFVKLSSPKSRPQSPESMYQANPSIAKSSKLPTIQKKASIIIIDDDDNDTYISDHSQQPVSPWIAQLNEFQTILDQFHHNLEENLLNFNKVNSNSKKISKRDRIIPSQPTKNVSLGRSNSRSIPTFS